ncbi:hypothetical protein ANN_13104 [Periplaneta americana]|uniref:Uncharacterized protein n=1 Tax=Periplaneta americana TaxID=6978 RepID=A0ABQ8TJG4_PERAM|nr:hypothetical protein ANN_13104 [Periplaneta americana]
MMLSWILETCNEEDGHVSDDNDYDTDVNVNEDASSLSYFRSSTLSPPFYTGAEQFLDKLLAVKLFGLILHLRRNYTKTLVDIILTTGKHPGPVISFKIFNNLFCDDDDDDDDDDNDNDDKIDTIIAWPARSPDLIPLDFFLWDYMKEKVYQTEIASREELVAKINTATMEIHQHGLNNVQREIRRRAEACVRARGGHFEHLL